MSKDYGKTVILTMIKDKKSLLFGSLPYPLSNEERHAAWKEIHEKAKSLGIVHSTKTWEYIRDVTWANWKRRTLEKRIKKKKTGTGGGKEVQYNEQDSLVLDIIGRETPLLEGLKVPASMDTSPEDDELLSLSSSPIYTAHVNTQNCASLAAASSRPKVLFRIGGVKKNLNLGNEPSKQNTDTEVEGGSNSENGKPQSANPATKRRSDGELRNGWQAKKFKLQLDLMEIDKRTKAIQLYNLEKKYNLPPSEFTKEFHDLITDE